MGLLEKADQIRSGESIQEAPPATPKPPPTTVLDPEPVQEAPKKKPKSRRRERKARTPRAKRTRQVKMLPDGFEEVTSGQRLIRRAADFTVSYGWCVPIVAIFAWGSNFDPTYFIVLGMLLVSFNLVFMPRSTDQQNHICQFKRCCSKPILLAHQGIYIRRRIDWYDNVRHFNRNWVGRDLWADSTCHRACPTISTIIGLHVLSL